VTVQVLLLVHAAAAMALAGIMWAVQLRVVPVLRQDPPGSWREDARTYRHAYRLAFWPLILVELSSGILIFLQHPPGIPPWVHLVNLALIGCGWLTLPGFHLAVGHAPLGRFDPSGFRRFAVVHWIRVVIWMVRVGVSLAMLGMAAPGTGG